MFYSELKFHKLQMLFVFASIVGIGGGFVYEGKFFSKSLDGIDSSVFYNLYFISNHRLSRSKENSWVPFPWKPIWSRYKSNIESHSSTPCWGRCLDWNTYHQWRFILKLHSCLQFCQKFRKASSSGIDGPGLVNDLFDNYWYKRIGVYIYCIFQ